MRAACITSCQPKMTERSRHRSGHCRRCARPLDRFGRCRRRTCPGHGPLWAKDWQSVVFRNLEHEVPQALVTVTAPGQAEGLPWDRSKCSHGPDERCSGPGGCRVLGAAAALWNGQAEPSWSKLHQASSARLRRAYGSGPVYSSKTWEPQARGVLHVHLAMPYDSLRDRRRCDAYVATLKELAPRYGFGFVDVRKPKPGSHALHAAGYLSKYVAKSITETAAQARRPAYVGRHLTTRSGITMRVMRWKRFFKVAWGFDLTHQEAGLLVALVRAFPDMGPAELVAAARAP